MTITTSDGFAVEDVSRGVCMQAVKAFAEGWKKPHPRAWDGLLAADVELHQPLMPDGIGVDHWQREFTRLQAFLPDIYGEILDWAPVPDGVLIHLRCHATAGGRPLSFDAIDRLQLSDDGTVIRRDSFFDPTPLIAALIARPRAWRVWWSSGMAPMTVRRGFLERHHGGRQLLGLGLGLTRIGVGAACFVRPQLVGRSLGLPPLGRSDAHFAARAFAARDICIGVAALSQRPTVATTGLRLGLFADAADTVGIVLGRRHGISRKAAITAGAATTALVVAGTLADTDK